MIEPNHQTLTIGSLCRLLSISRSSFYYEPQGETGMNLDLMRLIDKLFDLKPNFPPARQAIFGNAFLWRSPPSRTFCECPAGQRMTWHLRHEGHAVNQKRIGRLMRLMRLMPIYQKPNTSKPAKGHKIHPYLLGGLRIERPNQVWCADITYIPMRRGFLYLVAIMDWATRMVFDGLARPHRGHGPISPWRVSNTLHADFCIEGLDDALARQGPP